MVPFNTLSISALLLGLSIAAPPLFESEKIQLSTADLKALPAAQSSLFRYGDEGSTIAANRSCKVYPDDSDWPSDQSWATLNNLTDGRLLKPIPQASPCYSNFGNYNATLCAELSKNWQNSYIHIPHPLEMMSPVYQGLTCLPPNIYDSRNCTMGGFPTYVINATTPKHVQAGVNFARNTGVRLVVKNTGHDFSGKSGGKEALSIWTHYFKEIQYIEEYEDEIEGYKGPAFKCGSGVQAFEIYKAAADKGRVVVGGEGQTVGVMGGYIQGGGHSPLTSIYGTGADQVLAFEVVTPDGKFVTADSKQNSDLFWALRGGGGSTFGVATSVTVKAHPDVPTTASSFKFTSANVTNETFWSGVRAYFDYFQVNADAGTYAYFILFPNNPGPGLFTFQMTPFFAPNKTLAETESLLDPWFAQLRSLGIPFNPNTTHYDSFYPAWQDYFPLEVVEKTNVSTGSRFFPRANFKDLALLDKSFNAIRQSLETSHVFVGFNIKAVSPDNPSVALNPAWRDALLFAQQSVRWSPNATTDQIWAARKGFTFGDMQRWRDLTPGGGTYLGESDRLEPDFQTAFYGKNYPKLLELKRKFDPNDVLYAATAVGSEFWHIESVDTLPNENGRLCRVQ